jgi:YidC/Oxa1 family membrane protein insertase
VIGVAWFQALLNALGSVLAFTYKLIPNYGVAIIVLTLVIRLILLPLGIKQIRSMQGMQRIQPKMKELQKKYKGNRERLNQEMMALYKEHGVNPLSGCVPLLAQFPVLIALYAVLNVPKGIVHIPETSKLHAAIVSQDTKFLGTNLLCAPAQAGSQVKLAVPKGEATPIQSLNCGRSQAVRIPYYIFLLVMVGSTYYQSRQMQRASPPGSSKQQQAFTRIMPFMFGIFGFNFPAGLLVYWTTTNAVQIAQQHFMLPKKSEMAEEPPPRGKGRDMTSREDRAPEGDGQRADERGGRGLLGGLFGGLFGGGGSSAGDEGKESQPRGSGKGTGDSQAWRIRQRREAEQRRSGSGGASSGSKGGARGGGSGSGQGKRKGQGGSTPKRGASGGGNARGRKKRPKR